MRTKRLLGLVVVAIFLAAISGTASAASLDLPKWVIVPEDSSFSDVTLFCGFDAYDASTNTTQCYLEGNLTDITLNGIKGLVQGQIGNAVELTSATDSISKTIQLDGGFSFAFWVKVVYINSSAGGYPDLLHLDNSTDNVFRVEVDPHGTLNFGGSILQYSTTGVNTLGNWLFVAGRADYSARTFTIRVYDADRNLLAEKTAQLSDTPAEITSILIQSREAADHDIIRDDLWFWNKPVSDDEIKLLLLAGRKKLSQPANFRQIFSPMIDLTRDRATFYAGLEVSTSDPNGYVPVPESAVNMSITSAEKLKSDYTNADFYYQGHYWYRADKIQYNLPIQFETVRESGGFSHTILLDEDKKTFVYEKEFKVTNPTAARINVVYALDPIALGFSVLQYPQFELDGVPMAEWRPSNSTNIYLIRTDSLGPGEISTHWMKSTWTLSKEELNFPAKLDDFREITSFDQARKLAENAAEGKVDTYVRVIKIDSNADMGNMTVLVPLKDVKDPDDVIEATALTGARDTLQVEKLSDGKIVVKVPGQDFVSGHAEVKVLYNKSGGSWLSQLIEKIKSVFAKVFHIFGGG